ncbi:double-strand break repair protein AddB [Sphingomonas histidinilytica]|uniref:ATP-dependent helicase/nuclease subunit B n=2 Tax=Rhizorhabdus histidinilytica TaxID=439228 RepID=A0A1T5DHA9_9SPHN|nr:double-strand break repair protein AddB [Rhizorhabdus histidinilytica]MBO9379018.1 double-strand break repair protein AddB [Rhizorhabdus histidinilytica]SKB71115.1 ATP-dependent helicase/nuclease subunit B [Rhizorhabdus histidinilytica]
MSRPAVFTIPAHRAFADALAAGLIARHGPDPLGLARTVVLVPNNRAARAISDAFVRRAEGGLLLPRLVAIGDPELDERLGGLLDPIDAEGEGDEPIPPAIDPLERQMILARLTAEARQAAGDPIDGGEAIRLAGELGRTLDQMLIEQIPAARLRDLVSLPELSEHWQRSLAMLDTILTRWPAELAARGRIELAERRNRLLDRVARRWRRNPPPGAVIAAGISSTTPAVARLLGVVARLPDGMVVLPGLDTVSDEAEWRALGPHEAGEDGGRPPRPVESHPQYALKRLLDRMDVGRGEVATWRWGGGRDARSVRARAIANAMAPAAFTDKWHRLPPAERRLTGVRAIELANPAEEAQVIALALREAIETPGRTAALVTPDRVLARRVTAHLARWGIVADDSAGTPLSLTPAGTLLLAVAEAAAEGFAPVPLLALLKHPLVRRGAARGAWLDGARKLDIALRGPRPPAGLDGIARYLRDGDGHAKRARAPAIGWWDEVRPLLEPLEAAFSKKPFVSSPSTACKAGARDELRPEAEVETGSPQPTSPDSARDERGLGGLLEALRETMGTLADDAGWSGPDGRAAADLVAELEAWAPVGPATFDPAGLAPTLRLLMDAVAVRPPQGGHPRLSIWGLLEARLQHADLMVLGGLNEGVWPALPSPDPWLAPRIRAELGLPGLETRIGLSAHDFAMALGAPELIVTRARRDARAPTIASRFWLRLEAMTGGITREHRLPNWAAAIDRPADRLFIGRPEPAPPVADRPDVIAVTRLDRLQADPFAFYADAMLRLRPLDAVDADPTPAWRGTAVHAVFEAWMKQDDCDPDRLLPRAEAMLREMAAHPVMQALWEPRLIEALRWVADRMREERAQGRRPIAAELDGRTEIAGITLTGKVDRIDRLADGTLAIVDYKTGKPPSAAQVEAGYAMQLGLLGLIADRGGFGGVEGTPLVFEYWSLAKDRDAFGQVRSPVGGKSHVAPQDFVAHAAAILARAVERWLTGNEPFTAKLAPEYSPYADYDQLMRLDEWYGRGSGEAEGGR